MAGLGAEALASLPRDPSGLPAALDRLDPGAPPGAAQETADLFAGSSLFGGDQGAALLAKSRKGGRPAGSTNKTTDAWRDFILANYRSPLLFLADFIAADAFALHEALRDADRAQGVGDRETRLIDVLALQKQAAESLAAYVHRKQPIAIDAGEDKPLPSIQQVIVQGEAAQAIFGPNAGKTMASLLAHVPFEEAVAGEQSQDAGSHGAAL
jgi:hypothetical protein